ncbi:MAG: DUF4097 family beta strand repeat-containing protein [Acidobacteriota bacterium]
MRKVVIILVLLWACYPVWAEREVSKRVDASATGAVEISVVSGDVEVIGWERSEIEVTGRVGPGVREVRVERFGDRVEIEAEIRSSKGRRSSSVELVIKVPVGSRLDLSTVSAFASVNGVDGGVQAGTVSGGLEVRGAPERVQLETVSGTIEATVDSNNVDIDTVSGQIKLRGDIGGQVRASAVSGRLDLDLGAVDYLSVEAVTGSIRASADLSPRGTMRLASHSGEVEIRLPRSISARISASAFSGSIDNDLGPAAKSERHGPRKTLDFTLGDGEGRVELETFSGSIEILQR